MPALSEDDADKLMRRTHMHGGPSGYQTMSRTEQRLQLIHLQVRAKGVDSLSDRDRILWDSDQVKRKERKKPVQREAAIMQHVMVEVQRRWYWKGYRRWEARTHDPKRARDLAREGLSPDWPDCGLFVPCGYTTRGEHFLVRGVIEVKADHLRPKKKMGPFWWLEPFESGSRYGLRAGQAETLLLLAQCGISTYVAYGAEDVLAMLDEWAGPKPDVLPEGW